AGQGARVGGGASWGGGGGRGAPPTATTGSRPTSWTGTSWSSGTRPSAMTAARRWHAEQSSSGSPPFAATPADQELAHRPAVALVGQPRALVRLLQQSLQLPQLGVVEGPVQARGRP